MFKLIKKSKKSQARLGELKTAHGIIDTPFFMPIATKGAVKNLIPAELKEMGAQIILSNTYHLYLQPGIAVLKKAGGLHKFMNWQGPILTDSGGFQVFSLSKIRKILPQGVEFQSPLDGSKHLFTPKKVLEIQKTIGSDIIMVLDVCPASKASRQEVERAVELTTKWARETQKHNPPAGGTKTQKQLLFGIIQGGIYKDLRLKSLKDLKNIEENSAFGWDGYAIGGLAVGESSQKMYQVLDYLVSQMPKDKPRYLMGVGTPGNIVEAVRRGVDMFDCVIPTREARHGRLYIWKNSKFQITNYKQFSKFKIQNSKFYQTININNARFSKDLSPINQTNLKHYSMAYLHHLFRTNEPLGMRLATLNNLEFYLGLMRAIRVLIKNGKL